MHPDVIFCDILMPRLDGYQTCSLIKKSPRFHAIPVIMLSSATACSTVRAAGSSARTTISPSPFPVKP